MYKRDRLGFFVPPQVAVAAETVVASILSRAKNSILGIFDPGIKRDANRLARAQMWFEFADAGSVTAARRLHGGSQVQYTQKERQYYIDRWAQLVKDKPDLAQQAISLGDLGVPEPGSDQEPPSLPSSDIAALKQEIVDYNTSHGAPSPGDTGISGGSTSGGPMLGGLGGGTSNMLLLVGIGLAVASFLKKRR